MTTHQSALEGGRLVESGARFVKHFARRDEWDSLRAAHQTLRALPEVPPMEFYNQHVATPRLADATTLLAWYAGRRQGRDQYRAAAIDFVRRLNGLGYAHRDLNPKNILLTPAGLFVVDWDFVAEQHVPLNRSYDVTGAGLPSPGRTNGNYLFRSWRIGELPPHIVATGSHWGFYGVAGVVPSVAAMLGISPTDFGVTP